MRTLNRIQELARKEILASADIQQVFSLGNSAYRLIVSLSNSNVDQEEFAEAVGKATDYRVKTVAGTEAQVCEFGNLFSVFATANTPSRPYAEAANLKLLASNMFVDDEKNLWKVVGEGEDKRLVQMSNDNLDDVLASRLSHKIVTASYDLGSAKTGDYTVFFNSRTSKVEAGFAIETKEDGLCVFSRDTEVLEKIDVHAVISSVMGSDIKDQPFERKEMETAVTKEGLDKILSYMKRLYGGTDYFVEIEKAIKDRANMGERGLYKPTNKLS